MGCQAIGMAREAAALLGVCAAEGVKLIGFLSG